MNKKCFLILDKAPSHITKNVLTFFENKKLNILLFQLKNKYLINEANKLTLSEEVNPIKFNNNLSENNLDKLRLNLIYLDTINLGR